MILPDITDELRMQLQGLSNSGMRYIFGIKRSDHITPIEGNYAGSTPHALTISHH